MSMIKVILVLFLAIQSAFASATPSRIAVLDFELKDFTSLPYTAGELARTATFQPLLVAALTKLNAYEFIAIPPAELAAANPDAGYLFAYPDVAANFGHTHHADWIIVTRHSKPSFLFSYLMAHVIRVKTGQLIASFDIEMKGNHEKVTEHGIQTLATKIDKILAATKPDIAR